MIKNSVYQQEGKDLLCMMIDNYHEVANFVIFGSPATAKNSRVVTTGGSFANKEAVRYARMFGEQLERQKEFMSGIPFDDESYIWFFDIWYQNEKSDVSLDLIFDVMEYHGLISNDRTLRNYMVFAKGRDEYLPRINIKIFGEKK
jgi:hypothetical protein